MAQDVVTERRGAALWLRLNRPDRLNGLSPDVVEGIDAGLDAAEADDEVRAVVLAAEGRLFCAGADLKYIGSLFANPAGAADAQLRFLRRLGRTFDRVEAFGKPVIAAVHGPALAGGLELTLCADVVIAARSAGFGDAHANYGLIPGGGGTVRLPRRVGPSLAKYLMFTGQTLPAADLAHTDLVTRLVADDELVDEVDRVAQPSRRRARWG